MADERTSNATRFERVVLPYLDDAYTLARYLTRNATDADDVVQEAVLRALRYVHTLRSESQARAWLLAIVRRNINPVARSSGVCATCALMLWMPTLN